MHTTAEVVVTACGRARRCRRARGQAGFTLIEVVIAVAVAGLLVVSLAGAMVVIMRTGTATANRQQLDAGMGSFAESLHAADYLPCHTATAGRPDYDADYGSWPEAWAPPTGMVASVLDVDHWDGRRYVASCQGVDRGAQRLTLLVTWEGRERQAQIVKRQR